MSVSMAPIEIPLGPMASIPPGEGREFLISEQRIAVFHARDGTLYATQALCPHRDGPLADGLIGGSVVVCPLHARRFDLASGQSLSGDCDLKTYPVRLSVHGEILLTL